MNELLTMLDTKYKRLDYIQSTGTQYIDTGFKPNQNTTTIIDCFYNTRQQPDMFFGCYSYSSQIPYSSFAFGHNTVNNTTRIRAIYGSQSYINDDFSYNKRYIFKLDKNKFYADNQLLYTFNEETFTTVYNAQLFSAKVNNLNFIATLKIYSCQIYDNGTLVRNFIPVLRKSDNEIGMLDLVEGKFYTNAGTGKFTANLDTMYALIQGTPTVQDGRVSGFSSSNYLKLQEPIKPTGAFEIKLKFKISDNSKTNGLFHSSKTLSTGSGRFGFALVTASNGKLNFFASSDGSSWLFDKISASGLIQNNVDYYVKFGWTGTVYYVDLSTDDKIYNRVITYNSDVAVTQLIEYSSVGIYRAIDNIYPITNSIDLNRSYIKIDDTKYKLQAVVGWTKVGEPTIEDGVASGFSSSNYLQVNNALPTTIDNKYIFEGKTEITATTSGSYIFSFFCNAKSVTSVFGLLYRSSGYFAVVETNGTTVTVHAGTIAYQINTLYKYRVETDLNTYIRVYINDVLDISISLSYNNVHAYDGTIYYGIYPNGSVPLTNGTIDMNNTNIKINNKLWFNGLEQ